MPAGLSAHEVLARERYYFGNFDPFAETQISRFRDGWLLLRMAWLAYRKLKAI